MKKCSFCDNEIEETAIICHHCGKSLWSHMEKKRSVGVKIFGWVYIILFASFLWGAVLLPIFIGRGEIPSTELFLSALIGLLSISPLLLIGIGLLRFKNIARQISLVISFIIFIISFGYNILGIPVLLSGKSVSFTEGDIGLLIELLLLSIGSIFAIFYFMRPKIKEQFK